MDAWAIDASASAPSYNGQELRLSTVTPFLAGAGASLGVRSGVRPSGSGTDLLVQAQAAPNMSVRIQPGPFAAQGSISSTQGAYTWVNDTVLTRTIAAAHASLARTDLVVVRIRDANVDTSGQRDGDVVVITGTAGGGVPSLPTDATYVEIARVAVAAAVSTIVAGNITDKRPFTAGLGGVIYCPDSTTEPSASSVPASQLTYRADLGVFRAPFSGTWRQVTPYRQYQLLAATTGSITFSGVPNGIKYVQIRWTARGDTAAEIVVLALRLNGDTTGNYFGNIAQIQNGTQAISVNSGSTSQQVGVITASVASVGQFGGGVVDIEGIGSTTRKPNGQFRAHGWSTGAQSYSTIGGFLYNAVGHITSYTLLPGTGSFIAGSEFWLEGWD